jgi:hyperosmotically inducible protein
MKIISIGLVLTTAMLFNSNVLANTVPIDTLTSETTAAKPDTSDVAITPAQDKTINQTIQSLISNNKTLSNLDVTVGTNQGVVTLSGNVDSDSQASSLIELAQSVVGVKDVDASNLSIKASEQPFKDMWTTAKIKGLFIQEKVFGDKDIAAMNISVETQNGVVYLTGVINNKQQLKNAIKIIEGVKDVKKVEYNVKKVVPVPASNGKPA